MKDSKNREYFANKELHFTTFFHPLAVQALTPSQPELTKNLSEYHQQAAPESEEVTREASTRNASEPLSYPDQVVIFFNKRSNAYLAQKIPALKNSPMTMKVLEKIRTGGVAAFHNHVNAGGLAQVLSVFHDEISAISLGTLESSRSSSMQFANTKRTNEKKEKSSSPFEKTLSEFYSKLDERGYGKGPGKIKMPLERDAFVRNWDVKPIIYTINSRKKDSRSEAKIANRSDAAISKFVINFAKNRNSSSKAKLKARSVALR